MRSVPLAIVLLLVGAASPAPAADEETCVAFRLRAWGRPGHAATIDLHAAPHRLIRGLAALLPAAARELSAVRVRALAAAARPNVKPATSEAVVEVTAAGTRVEVVSRVEALLAAEEVALEALPGACRPPAPPATTAG